MEGVTNFIKLQSNENLRMSPDGDFFRAWVDFHRPIHKLTKREMDVLAAFLKKRWELSKKTKDEDALDNYLMSEEVRSQISKECGMNMRHLRVTLSTFRKRGILVNEKFIITLLPTITKDGACLMVYFDFKDEQKLVRLGTQASRQKSGYKPQSGRANL